MIHKRARLILNRSLAWLLLLLLGWASPTLADHKPMEVNHDNDHSWKIDVVGAGAVTFEVGPADCNGTLAMTPSPPLGTGSVRLFVPDGSVDAAQLRSTRYHGTPLDDLIALEYWACARINNGQQWPYIILNIDHDGDNVTDDLIFFEPAYQNPVDGNPNVFECPNQGFANPTTWRQWQRWDARNGCWWSLSFPAAGSPGTGVKPLRHYTTLFPNARIINADGNRGGLRLVQGFGDPLPHDGFVDRVEIATKKVIYDMDNP